MYILANMWFQKLMIQFFFGIDKIVYNFISSIYNLLMSIARTTIFSQADIAEFADRIYNLLAVFMIFKVTFSLILYIVNPDDFSDKNKGFSKLGTNIVISLCLLILTPYIFNYAYELQTLVLEENTIAKLIMGDNSKDNYINNAGDEIAYITMSAFFAPNTSNEKLYDCSTVVIKKEDGKVKFNPDCSGLDENYNSTGDSNSLMALTNDKYFDETLLKNYVTGVENSSLGLMFRQDLALATDEENDFFIMDYKWIISTVVGVVIILLLLTFCMDIAVRSIKLAFLQLVAPIPIISYVDPKSGKDGLFKKWYQMCFSTYLSLFIRLLSLFFAIYIISKVASLKMVDLIDGSYQTNKLVAIFIIIGALMFAKQLPKILENLGFKLDGGFTLNPLKKIEKDAIGGGMLKGFNDSLAKTGQTLAKVPFRAAAGVGTAALVGGTSLLSGHGLRGMGKALGGAMKGEKFGKNFSNSYSAAKARHKQVDEMKANGVRPSQVRKEKLYNAFHGSARAEKVQQVADKSKAIQSAYDTIKNQAVACDADDSTVLNRNGRRVESAKTISKELDEMKKTQIDRASFKDIEGKTAKQQFDADVNAKNTQIQQLETTKKEYQDKTSQINLEASRLKNERDNLQRTAFDSDNDFYEAQAAYNQRLAVLEEQKKSYDFSNFDQEIENIKQERDALDVADYSDIGGKTAEEQYNEALAEQKKAVAEKEADLEYRIKALANGRDDNGVEITIKDKNGKEVASANKVIEDAKNTMIKLTETVNKTGEALDPKFEGITIKPESDGSFDVVNAMKQSRGTAAQATNGKLSEITDIGKYTGGKK